MILLQVDILRMIADFIGVIFLYSKVVLTPIGEVMKLWIEAILNIMVKFVPIGRYEIYIIIFIILVISGVIINYHWPGEKKVAEEKEKSKTLFLGHNKKTIS
ncbi:unnamed protein product [marine sediment metagenome]|uniref:Uncharacterized protein n=1 Tax=marine sediment metagenome TaxID=412755 RepID=X0ZDX8_9ZZZZ